MQTGKGGHDKVNFNVACAVFAWDNIPTQDFTDSFRSTGIYPFQRNFALNFKTNEEVGQEAVEEDVKRIRAAGIACRICSVIRQRVDTGTQSEFENILRGNDGASRKIEQLTNLLQTAETVSAIVRGSVSCSTRESTA